MPGVEFEFAYRCCLYDAFVHFQAREMGNKSKKNYLARRDVFNWTERMDDALPVNKGWETGLIVFSQLQPMIIWRGNCVKTSACHLKKIT